MTVYPLVLARWSAGDMAHTVAHVGSVLPRTPFAWVFPVVDVWGEGARIECFDTAPPGLHPAAAFGLPAVMRVHALLGVGNLRTYRHYSFTRPAPVWRPLL